MVMKYLSMLLLSVFLLTSCNVNSSSKTPLLKVSNKAVCAQALSVPTIIEVTLDGYEFTNLTIEVGEFEVFYLDEGMPSGYEDVTVRAKGPYGISNNFTSALDVNFRKGITTKVRIVNPDCNSKDAILELD